MSYKHVLKHLGFNDNDRIVVFNADDFGMCESSISAVDELFQAGILSSASIMPPCPWFPAAAQWSLNHPEYSVGVHLSLTSEWSTYRWQPCCDADAESGLTDQAGYLHQERRDVSANAKPDWVLREMQTQVQRCIDTGMILSHIDAHMYSVMLWPFLKDYLDLYEHFGIPVLAWSLEQRPHFGYPEADLPLALELIDHYANDNKAFLFDKQLWTRMAPPAATIESVKEQLKEIPPGLTRFYIHPAKDSPELRAIVPDWQCRVADYEVFSSPKLKQFIDQQGIHIISSLELKQAIHELYRT